MASPIDREAPGASAEPARLPTPRSAREIKRRLLERVADADASHLTIGADEGDWQPFCHGVRIKVLREHDEGLSYLLRLEPGATLPAHRHPVDEECVVLEGRLRVGTCIEVGAGGYHLAHRGALHATISTATGATIFLRGCVPEARHALV
jgi:quercetin dioxygenase-like cupin family protein